MFFQNLQTSQKLKLFQQLNFCFLIQLYIATIIFNCSNNILYLEYQMQNQFVQIFLTSAHHNQVSITPQNVRHAKVREQIKNIILLMPSVEICQQAVITLGLNLNILDFTQVLKQILLERSLNNLTFTLYQMKSIYKEVNKLKNLGYAEEKKVKGKTNMKNLKQISVRRVSEKYKKDYQTQIDIKKALEDELAFRNKTKLFYSTDKIAIKQIEIKKKIDKARMMNKKALKIYKSYKQKQQKSYESFKIQAIFDGSPRNLPYKFEKFQQSAQLQQLVRPQCHLSMKNMQSIYQNVSNHKQTVKVLQKCKTSNQKKRQRYDFNQNNQQKQSMQLQKYLDYQNRALKTRQRRQIFSKQRQEKVLIKVIKKQERINCMQLAQLKQFKKRQKRIVKQNLESGLKSQSSKSEKNLQLDIQNACLEKQLKKQLFLQERVNKVRQQLKQKQQRRQKHKQQKEKQFLQVLEESNISIYKNYIHYFKIEKQEQDKQQIKIKKRFEYNKNKQNKEKHVNELTKLSNYQIQKTLQKLKNNEVSSSILNVNLA